MSISTRHTRSAVIEAATDLRPARRGRGRTRSLEPLAICLMGVPLWWVLGLFQAMFFASALLMALYLVRRRDAELPPLFMLWMLFLAWTLGGVLTLQVDAPGAVPGSSSARYLTFSYRFVWYLVSTVALLYVVNTHNWLSSERICRIISWFFVILVGGGLLGLLLPHLTFPSLLELILPSRITNIPFAHDLIHPTVAQVQNILGDPEPRPSAPFTYTNEWGMAVATSLPFFVESWWTERRRDRVVLLVVLTVAVVPIVASLNRGLWLAILGIAVFTACRSALLGDLRKLALVAGVGVFLGLTLAITPLGSTVQERFETPHSDQVRENLGTQSVTSALEGSPLIGFGSTRDVAGNFNSIAGGASGLCPGCEAPPLGTHGQAWQLIFFSGVGGLVLYISFLGSNLVRYLRSRAPGASAALSTIFVCLITMPIYLAAGINLLFAFLAIGLLARTNTWAQPGRSRSLRELSSSVRAGSWIIVAGLALGTTAGLGVHRLQGEPVRASQSVLVPAVDLVEDPDAREFTLDSEAELARSTAVVTAVAETIGEPPSEVAQNLSIGARPNTRVLTLSYSDVDEARAMLALETVVPEYLELRTELHHNAVTSLERRLTEHYERLRTIESDLEQLVGSGGASMAALENQIAEVTAGLDSVGAEAEIGRPVSQITVQRSQDALMVRAGSGAVVGAVVGIVFAVMWGRHAGAGARRLSRTTALPVLITLDARAEDDRTDLLLKQVRPYLPLGAVLADAGSAEATHLAAEVDQRITTRFGRSPRTLLIVSNRTSAASAQSMIEECRSMHLNPVGLAFVSGDAR